MGTIKLGDKDKATTLNAGAYVTAVYPGDNGKIVLIDKASLVEIIRAEMATATADKKGLMSVSDRGKINGLAVKSTTNLNEIATTIDNPFVVLSLYPETQNSPRFGNGSTGWGVAFHVQRATKDVTTGSQICFQIAVYPDGVMFFRTGSGIYWGAWKQVGLTG